LYQDSQSSNILSNVSNRSVKWCTNCKNLALWNDGKIGFTQKAFSFYVVTSTKLTKQSWMQAKVVTMPFTKHLQCCWTIPSWESLFQRRNNWESSSCFM
jgi:hypothetical protein